MKTGFPYQRAGISLLLLALLLFSGCYKEQVTMEPKEWLVSGRVLEFDQVYVFADHQDKKLLYTLASDTVQSFRPHVNFGDYDAITFNGLELNRDAVNDLGEVRINFPYQVVAHKSSRTETFQLYFTNLPLLHVHTDKKIRDEPKVLSWLELQYVTEEFGGLRTAGYTSYTGIEIRGRTSAQLEKKSYGLELWENVYQKDHSAPLLGMRNGEDWILDAMYIDKLRMRNKLSFELWEKMWSQRTDTPWPITPPGIHCKYVELFINHRYMGLYCLSEKLDESLINLSGNASSGEGVLYKAIDWTGGATAFESYNSPPPESMIWEGWEQVCPENYFYWEPLSELRKSVVLDEDELFIEKIDSLVDLDCLAEYYLFANLILAHDNIIKNYYLARYPGQTRFLVLPWDLEGSWGIMWHGGMSSCNGLLENNLYKRLLELNVGEFQERLESKWETYRASLFQLDSLMAPTIFYTDLLKRSGAIDRENARWEDAEIDLDQERLYFTEWIRLRLDYLDQVLD